MTEDELNQMKERFQSLQKLRAQLLSSTVSATESFERTHHISFGVDEIMLALMHNVGLLFSNSMKQFLENEELASLDKEEQYEFANQKFREIQESYSRVVGAELATVLQEMGLFDSEFASNDDIVDAEESQEEADTKTQDEGEDK